MTQKSQPLGNLKKGQAIQQNRELDQSPIKKKKKLNNLY